jgi:multicomponent Na+:H+ antiporter subunit E
MFGLWVMLSGHLDIFMLSIGALCSLFVTLIALRIDIADHDPHLVKLRWIALTYWPWLTVKIIQSNLDVVRHILKPKLQISPTIIQLKSNQKTDIGRVTYANSITLTPGTVTMDIRQDTLHVHALTREAAEELLQGEMDRRVCEMERQ